MQDLLILGGGIVGTGVARDAALRGLRVTLIEELRKGVNFEAPKTDEAAADADGHQPGAAPAPPEEKR